MRGVERASRPVSLLVVLLCLLGTMAVGAAAKSPCASGDWSDGRQYRWFCYSDIVPLLNTEQLAGGRLPFLRPCAQEAGVNCDEYPVLTMYFMRAALVVGGNTPSGFFVGNVLLLWICAAAIATWLYMLGGHPLRFVLAPTLLIYGFMNWDLFAVMFATGALLAFSRKRDVWAGVLLGLGAGAKFYPLLLAVPLIADRLHDREPDGAIRIGWATAGTWFLVNLPFALASPSSWWTFFRFNSARPADWDSLWYIGCQHVHVSAVCSHTSLINLMSAAAFVLSLGLVWMLRQRREPAFARWTLGFPLLVLFLLSNKVYSPQYGLWLLPWFALGMTDLRAFVAFEVADVAVFITRFSFFGRLSNVGGLPFGAFEIAIALRTAVLIWCVVEWVRRPSRELPQAEPAIGMDEAAAPA